MHEVVILAGAENDVLETYTRYESAQDGLGTQFSDQLEKTFGLISDFPHAGPIFTNNIRRVLVRAFPYGIFYCIEGRRVMVQAVLDLRQSPEAIYRRLGIL